MRVIGTAGHVDHGKSTLVEALTGIHPDRLKEEREREMTIDLGFAWLTLPDGEEVGIVDVPGHRDFIENMLAGVGGIDAALFVVAADEGVMPQTREHLAILDLLQVQGGIVVLTKIDLVADEDWLDLVEADAADGEVPRLRMREVDPADACGRHHRERLRERDAELLRAEQVEELALLGVVGASGIARRGPDAAVTLANHILRAQRFILAVAPRRSCAFVSKLGKGFRQAIGEGAQVGLFSCSKATNELNFATQKLSRIAFASNNIDSCNRT